MYVSSVPMKDEETGTVPKCTAKFLEEHKIKINNNGGATLSIKKHKGWTTCFQIAKKVAMWQEDA